ncbi:hypothetical protein Pla52n_65530 [Stieleria varia]|uniref:Uncharacterized protein n=1 Tax=Stieleria varia TaxID=2528005 RepID=A0A5C5ZVI4_9BACT|nr:hypothetical protein Pla52n_65530 [Stieleria varia]
MQNEVRVARLTNPLNQRSSKSLWQIDSLQARMESLLVAPSRLWVSLTD